MFISNDKLGVIKGHHQHAVHLLSFFNSDNYLASSSINLTCPILIHNLNDFSLLLSTYIPDLTIDLFNITFLNITDNHQKFNIPN